jgi:hypothetical protein
MLTTLADGCFPAPALELPAKLPLLPLLLT